MPENKWIYFPVLGLLFGIPIGFLFRIVLLSVSHIDIPIDAALRTGSFWGILFSFLNAAIVEALRGRNAKVMILCFVFATNFILVICITFFWLLPLPNIYYVVGLATIVSIIALATVIVVMRK